MNKYLQTGLALFYCLLTAYFFLCILYEAGMHLNNRIFILGMAAWTLFCFSSAYFNTDIYLFFHLHARKPVLAEEERLQRCLGEVMQRAGAARPCHLQIEEKSDLDAYAVGLNTIVLSRGLLAAMTDPELKGILAHELGHIVSKDCIAGSAFYMAGQLPGIVKWTLSLVRRQIGRKLGPLLMMISRISIGVCIIMLLFMVYLLDRKRLIVPILTVILLSWLLSKLSPVFRFFWLLISRYTEYKQDAYAWELGYGTELRAALYKLTLGDPQPVNGFVILMSSSHPVIYNRIRKLEKLEGLR